MSVPTYATEQSAAPTVQPNCRDGELTHNEIRPEGRSGLSRRTWFFIGVWSLFVLLVLGRINGSSASCSTEIWTNESYNGYLLGPVRDWLKAKLGRHAGHDLDDYLMARGRAIRSDEWLVQTPWALSQAAHDPPFPVVNTNIGNGQNMLLVQTNPVWHIVALARPATWGFLFLGVDHGMAWSWWFQCLGCFTVLALLLEVILKGRRRLACLGAAWYCGSAHIVCWSMWTAYYTFFPALGCLSAYHLLKSKRWKIQVLCGVLLGLSVPGFLMSMYPPHQVVLGLFFLLVFVGLVLRDKLWRVETASRRHAGIGSALALLIAVLLVVSFLVSAWPAIKVMNETAYPGQRSSLGGGYPFALVFKGFYNALTNTHAPAFLYNKCEAASFHLLFPAVLAGLVLMPRVARRFGLIGWLLLGYVLFLVYFVCVGVPPWLARITLLSYTPSYRADIGLGLASIFLVIMFLAARSDGATPATQWMRFAPGIVAVVSTGFLVVVGYQLRKVGGESFPPHWAIGTFSGILGGCVFLLSAGRARAFAIATGVILVFTSGFFNPLTRGFGQIYDGELACAIQRFNYSVPDRPLWLCYGDRWVGTLVTVVGGRSLSGVYYHPQLELWHQLDPNKKYDVFYNRGAAGVALAPHNEGDSVQMEYESVLLVHVSPYNSVLKRMGARYAVATEKEQAALDAMGLKQLYRSREGWFSIYEIPDSPPQREAARQAS